MFSDASDGSSPTEAASIVEAFEFLCVVALEVRRWPPLLVACALAVKPVRAVAGPDGG